MTETMTEWTCTDLASALASKESVPGGGAAAAYAGALAAALGSMVANFTTGKKKYAAYKEDIQRILEESIRARIRLMELMDADAACFYPLSQAYGIPKDDPTREETLEQCTKAALASPLAMMQETCSVIELLEELEQKGSRLLLSDVGCGAALARAALESAALNVVVNTAGLKDRTFAASTDENCSRMLREYCPRAQAIVDAVMASLRV